MYFWKYYKCGTEFSIILEIPIYHKNSLFKSTAFSHKIGFKNIVTEDILLIPIQALSKVSTALGSEKNVLLKKKETNCIM